MIRNILASLVLVAFSNSVFADSLELSVNPETPIVLTSDSQLPDGTPIYGPWIKADLNIKNILGQTVTVVGFRANVTDKNGQQTSYHEILFTIEIAPGDEFSNRFYLSQLPLNNSHEYDIEIQILGWIGTEEKQEDRLVSPVLKFKTQ